jgi:hypothetical protein
MPTPTKFTAETRRIILEALREGNSRETAAPLAGTTPATLSRWISRGAESQRGSLYRQFAEDVAMAEAAARGRALRILNSHMQDQPKWAAWFLERRDPAFAPPATHQLAPRQGPIMIALKFGDGQTAALPSSSVEVVDVEPDSPSQPA